MSETDPRPGLAVDPSFPQLQLATSALILAGLKPYTASNALDALDLALSLRPQLILTELVLPGFSGLEFIRRCRAQGCSSTHILAVTSAPGDWPTAAAFAAGADYVLLKPVAWESLVFQVRAFTCGPARQIRELLLAHGIPGHRLGVDQAARCAELLIRHKDVLMKEIYFTVAQEGKTSPQCVAKNVERLIKELAQRKDLGFLGFSPDAPPPGNKDFLAALARSVTFPL